MYRPYCILYCVMVLKLVLVAEVFVFVVGETLTERLLKHHPFDETLEIVLNSESLTGTIPTLIGKFANLTRLELQMNNLTGSIPTQIFELRELDEINVNQNLITGTIPSQIGKLGKLRVFSTRINALTGTIPEQIGNCLGLQQLVLEYNYLTGTIPVQIFKPDGIMQVLDLRQNALTGIIPTQIGLLISSGSIALSHNHLSGTIPTQIGKLEALDTVLLEENQLNGEMPIQLSLFSSLHTMTLAKNNFDIHCVPDFLNWYIPFANRGVLTDKYDFSLQCLGQVYPFQLDPANVSEEPRDSVGRSIRLLSGSRNVTLNWTYPNISQLADFAYTNDNSALVSDFRKCKPYNDAHSRDFTDSQVLHELVGFEISILKQDENSNRVIAIRECIKADDLEKNDGVFRYSLNLLIPATQYEIIIRAFNLNQISFKDTQRYVFIFGPPSATIPFKTKDDIPEAAPESLRSISATESSIELTWDETETLLANGEITKYRVHSLDDGLIYSTNIRQITISGLEPNKEYRYQVRAATSTGFSDIFSDLISARTCPREMKRSDETNCFARQGSFTVSEGKALVCEVEVPDIVAGCETEEQLTVQTLDILPGFWRPNINEFTEIQSCPVPEFCSKQRSTTSRILMNDTEIEPESKQCALFHRGVYCSSCDDGYVLSGADGCIKCTDDLKSSHETNYALFIVFISFIVIICVGYVFFKVAGSSSHVCSSIRDGAYFAAACAWNRVAVKLRIIEGFLQVMFAFQSLLYVDSTGNFLTEALGSIANLNLGLLAYGFEVECVVDVNHYLGLLLYTVPSLVLGLLLFSLYKVCVACRSGWKESLTKECFNMFFIVSFLIYPGVSKVIFDTFFCEEFNTVDEDTEYIFQSALRADYRLSCSFSADGRIGWLVYAVLMALIFPFGILTTYVYFLRQYSQDHDIYDALVKDLVYPYKEDRYWFEAYELIRKLLQTAFVSFCLLFGTQVASSVSLNISVIALLVLVYLNPYNNPTDFCFAVVTLSTLVFATQLTAWFDTEDCNRSCRTERINDAIASIILFEIVAAICFVGLDKYVYPDGVHAGDSVAVVDETGFDKEQERLRAEVAELKEKNSSHKEEINELREENNSNKEENGLLRNEIERLKSEIEGYKHTFA